MNPVLLLLLVSACWAQNRTPDGCFQISHQQRVFCGTFGERRSGLSEEECQNLCREFASRCYVAQYAVAERSCDLFFQSVAGIRQRRRKRQQYVPYRQYVWTNVPAYTQAPYTFPVYTQAPYPQPAPSSRCGAGPIAGDCMGYKLFVPTGNPGCNSVSPAFTTRSPVNPPSGGAGCPAGKVPRFTAISGVSIQGNDDIIFSASSESDCLQACSLNQAPTGQQIECMSAEYTSGTRSCVLSTNSFPPTGDGTPMDTFGTTYYEKICVNQRLADSCPGGLVRRTPQKILVGFAEQVKTVNSLDECVEACLDSQNDGFVCSSGMIYYDENDLNCILNTVTADEEPSLFIEEPVDTVDYFELQCDNRKKRVRLLFDAAFTEDSDPPVNLLSRTDPWGEWTPCDSVAKLKFRFRNCKEGTANPKNCIVQSAACTGNRKQDVAKVEEQCNPLKRCCALRKSDGSLDCDPTRGGYRYRRRNGSVSKANCSRPSDCR